jgi:glutamine synthetase
MSDHTSTLKKITNKLVNDTGLTPHVATEMEFYLENAAPHVLDVMFPDCYKQFGAAGILTHRIEKEVADGQFEISLVHRPDPLIVANNTLIVKDIIASTAEQCGLSANFFSKPNKDKPGSGLHIHVSLYDEYGVNVFQKEDSDDQEESMELRHALSGLCATMNEAMIFFAPYEESYSRYEENSMAGETKYNNSPINISWGGNNRTVAIRIPTSTLHPEMRHLEHRVSGVDADPYLAIAAILAGIDYGLANKLEPSDKIWGNAYDKQYELPPLPKSLKQAEEEFNNGTVIKEYFI